MADFTEILLKDGTIHIGNSEVVENGIITFEKGQLTFVGPADEHESDSKTYKVIDMNGQKYLGAYYFYKVK